MGLAPSVNDKPSEGVLWGAAGVVGILVGFLFAAIPFSTPLSALQASAVVTFAVLLVVLSASFVAARVIVPSERSAARRVSLEETAEGRRIRVHLLRFEQISGVIVIALLLAFAVEAAIAAYRAGHPVLFAALVIVAVVLAFLVVDSIVGSARRPYVILDPASLAYEAGPERHQVAWSDVLSVGEFTLDQVTVGKVFVNRWIEVRLAPSSTSLVSSRHRRIVIASRPARQGRLLIPQQRLDRPGRLLWLMEVLHSAAPDRRSDYLNQEAVEFLAGAPATSNAFTARLDSGRMG